MLWRSSINTETIHKLVCLVGRLYLCLPGIYLVLLIGGYVVVGNVIGMVVVVVLLLVVVVLA